MKPTNNQQTDLFCPKCGRHLRPFTKSLTGETVYKCGHGTPIDHTIKESEAKIVNKKINMED